jgi:CP family cyanate transporter-like MFS transporter
MAAVGQHLRLIFATVGPLLATLELGFTSTLLVTTLPPALLGIFSIPGVQLRKWLGEAPNASQLRNRTSDE